jgi:dihydrofolate reductase
MQDRFVAEVERLSGRPATTFIARSADEAMIPAGAGGLSPRTTRTRQGGAMGTRDLVVTENITLDGVIEATEGWFGPAGTEGVDQSDIEEAIAEQREAADVLLLGRVTFEEMRGFWPLQTDDETGISAYLDAVEKYVVSRTLDQPGWERTTVLRGTPAEEVEALKERPGRDIVVTGSMRLVGELVAAGLVDEYRLFVYPVVLGRGRRLFEGATAVPALRLVETRPFRSGVVLLRYRTD